MWIGPVIFACPVSKQMHRTLEAISLAYASQGADYPIGVRAHSTRGLASSWAMFIKDICLAGWSPQNIFARFYNFEILSFALHALSVQQEAGELSLDG